MASEQIGKVKGGVYHLPTVMGGVVLAYNLPGVATGVKLTWTVCVAIFLGEIAYWKDKAIRFLANSDMNLPEPASPWPTGPKGGSTNIFTDYLTRVNTSWAGTGRQGNGGEVAGRRRRQGQRRRGGPDPADPGLHRVRGTGLRPPEQASVRVDPQQGRELSRAHRREHRGGGFGRAEEHAIGLPDHDHGLAGSQGLSHLRVHLAVGAPQDGVAEGKTLVDFLDWAYDNGEGMAESMDYVPLPDSLIAKVKAKIATIKY